MRCADMTARWNALHFRQKGSAWLPDQTTGQCGCGTLRRGCAMIRMSAAPRPPRMQRIAMSAQCTAHRLRRATVEHGESGGGGPCGGRTRQRGGMRYIFGGWEARGFRISDETVRVCNVETGEPVATRSAARWMRAMRRSRGMWRRVASGQRRHGSGSGQGNGGTCLSLLCKEMRFRPCTL